MFELEADVVGSVEIEVEFEDWELSSDFWVTMIWSPEAKPRLEAGNSGTKVSVFGG